jgi:hypothetical protein
MVLGTPPRVRLSGEGRGSAVGGGATRPRRQRLRGARSHTG